MSSNIRNVAFLRESRSFPADDIKALAVQVDRAYVDIAQNVNSRTLGVFATNSQVATGESWYLQGGANKQQTLRKVFVFTTSGNIAHGIDFTTIAYFTSCYGSYTDGTNWYGLIFGSNTTISGQINFYITATNIVIQNGAGAPSLTEGVVVIEWLSTV